ncbi:MAG TPA: GNAT family N-acetyltransferase [Mycobacteriales bacterium]
MTGDATVGRRVVLRRRVAGPDGRPQYSDVVGVLVEDDPSGLTVRRRDGDVVTVPAGDVALVRTVAASPLDVLALEEVAAQGWRAPDADRLGGWLLRAAEGWTGRANSVLPLGDPGLPLADALAFVTDWYARRGLRARFQLPEPGREALAAALTARGWTGHLPVRVLTADVGTVLRGLRERRDLPPVAVEPEPSGEWMGAYHYRGEGGVPPVARAVLTGSDRPGFAIVRSGGAAVAIARASVDAGWVGVTAVEVDPGWRRRGLARHVMRGVLTWAARLGARDSYLQVSDDNAAALALYAGLGYAEHHRYSYRVAPSAPSAP